MVATPKDCMNFPKKLASHLSADGEFILTEG